MTEALRRLRATFSIRWRLVGLVVLVCAGMFGVTTYVWQHEQEQRAAAEQASLRYGELARLRELQTAYGSYRYWVLAQIADVAEHRSDWQAQNRVRIEQAAQDLHSLAQSLQNAIATYRL